jgi:dipeptidyl aminopeptidase/acylaminoacyl peptidase
MLLAAALIPLELFFSPPEYSLPKLSPDGTQLAWIAPGAAGVPNVWVRSLPSGAPHQVTRDTGRGIQNYLWSPDSRSILSFQDNQGDENFHLFATPAQGGETRQLTPLPGVRVELLAVVPARHQLLLLMNRRERRYFEVYRLDLTSGSLELDTENPGDFVEWAVDARGEVRAALAYRRDGSQQVMVRDAPQAPWRVLETFSPEETLTRIVGFAPGGQALWLLSSAGADTARLVEFSLTGARPPRVLARHPRYDVADALLHPRSGELAAVGILAGRMVWRFRDATLRRHFASLRRLAGKGDLRLVSTDASARLWVVSLASATEPARYFLYSTETQTTTPLFSARPALAGYPLAEMRPIRFQARDGLTIHGYLTMPVARSSAPPPAALLVHGGPWVRDVYGYSGVVQFLASRGWAVLQVNYRGSSGYGKAFLNAGNRQWGAKMLDDLVDAKRWAERHGFARPDRVAIMGASFGGYLTLSALAFTPTEFACGVDIVGQSNLLTFLRAIPPFATSILALYDRRVGNLERDHEMLRARSPFFHASRIVRPLLVGQGANDPRVPQSESDQIVAALRAQNKPVTYIVFPDEGHGFVKPANILRFMTEVDRFLGRCLSPPAP